MPTLDWDNALPVLVKTYELSDTQQSWDMSSRTVATALHQNHNEISRILDALKEAGYVSGEYSIDQVSGTVIIDQLRVTSEGLQHVGRWPGGGTDAAVSRLLVALERAVDEADEGSDERTKLQTIKDSAGEVSRQTLVGVLSRVITGQI